MKNLPCEGKPRARVCPGECNPRSRGTSNARQIEVQLPYHHHHEEKVVNRNVYYKHEFALFSAARNQDSLALSPEERQFLDGLSRRIEARRRDREQCSRGRFIRRFLAFLLFFFLHGCIAALANNYHYQHYQTFLATQFCGFITIMFWDAT